MIVTSGALVQKLQEGVLLAGVIRVSLASEWTKPAWSVYKFSLLYLALLFVAMVIDRKVLG